MRYLFLKNLSIIKDKTWKILIGYFLLMIIVTVFWKFNDLSNDITGFGSILGLGAIKDVHILIVLVRVFKLAFYIYIVFKIVVDDLIFSTYNTFLRFSRKNWIVNKIISVILIILLLKFFEYLIVIIFFNFNFQILVNLFFIDFLNSITIMMIVLFVTLINSKIKIVIILLLLVTMLKYLLVNIYDIKAVMFLTVILITFFLNYYNSKNILKD